MPANRISDIWEKMTAEKGDLIDRAEAFSRWTVAAIMPADGGEKVEQIHGNVPQGARLVNHLSNRVVDVLFPVSRPFFTVAMTPEAKLKLEQEMGEEQSGAIQEAVRDATSRVEEAAMRGLHLTAYRPVAIMGTKHLIVTGNALLRRMPEGERVLYPVNRYGVRRDILGNEIEVVLADKKVFSTFEQATQALILAASPNVKQEDEIELLTHYVRENGRWKITQEAEGVPLAYNVYQNDDDYDLLILSWSLHPGENYGRGLVEAHATLSHQVDVMNEAIQDPTAIIADIKFFVRPGSWHVLAGQRRRHHRP